MKTLAVLTAVMLALAPVAQASAGPLREVPASHWAYDAVAELTTMGLVEGYPVSAFHGDRAITRYEMAVVVARVLARLDTARPPTPPSAFPTIQRLVVEFRPELRGLGIRAGTAEDDLKAMSSSAAGPRIAGVWRMDPWRITRDSVSLAPSRSERLSDDAMNAVGAGVSRRDLSDWVLLSGTVGLPPLAGFGGSGWGLDISRRPAEGRGAFADWATWSNIPSLAAPPLAGAAPVQVGGILDLARFGINTWSGNLDLGYRHPGSHAAGGLPPVHTYATIFPSQEQTRRLGGWLVRLTLSFTPRTTGSIYYERGRVIPTGQPYTEWALRMAHRMAPNTTVALNYYRTRCGVPGGTPCPGSASAGETERFYRAELLYSW
jgi:hypothetical protein